MKWDLVTKPRACGFVEGCFSEEKKLKIRNETDRSLGTIDYRFGILIVLTF
jgi:hypothetical protein